jgi:hypothetical protein
MDHPRSDDKRFDAVRGWLADREIVEGLAHRLPPGWRQRGKGIAAAGPAGSFSHGQRWHDHTIEIPQAKIAAQ